MVLRWRPNCRAICAWLSPCLRPAESIYLSSEVSWWYVIVVSLVLADGRNRKYSSAPHLGARVLHLLYEFAGPNPSLDADVSHCALEVEAIAYVPRANELAASWTPNLRHRSSGATHQRTTP